MPALQLDFPEEELKRLELEADRLDISVPELMQVIIDEYFNVESDDIEEDDDYIEPTKEEILNNIRESLIDALAGRVVPYDEAMAELRKEFGEDVNQA